MEFTKRKRGILLLLVMAIVLFYMSFSLFINSNTNNTTPEKIAKKRMQQQSTKGGTLYGSRVKKWRDEFYKIGLNLSSKVSDHKKVYLVCWRSGWAAMLPLLTHPELELVFYGGSICPRRTFQSWSMMKSVLRNFAAPLINSLSATNRTPLS